MKKYLLNHFRNNITAKIFISYSIAVVLGASIFYDLVPRLLSYAPGYAYIDKLHGMSYSLQFIIMVLCALLIGYSVIKFLLRGVKEIEDYLNNPDKQQDEMPENLVEMKKKLLNLPYQLYIIQIAVPEGIVMLLIVPLFVIQKASLFVFFRVFILLTAFFVLVSEITLIISQTALKRILLKFEADNNIEGIRLPLIFKFFIQILPMFIVAISISSLIGYSNTIEEKGNLISNSYMTELNDTFAEYKNEELSIEQIWTLLHSIRQVSDIEDNRFIITPNKNVLTTNNEPLGDYFLTYLWEISLKSNGHVYDVTEEIRGTIVKVKGTDGDYIVGIKFNVATDYLTNFYVISFIFILLICTIVLYFLSKAMSDDILTVANSLNEIASGEYVGLDKQLPISSNDEISDLVIAFNKIQRLVQKHIKQIRYNHDILIQQERMASLGQLVGGIAHSLKTPISTASDAVFCIEQLADEYEQSIDIPTVTKEDHHSIAQDIKNNVKDLKETLDYINSVINTVKNHSADLDKSPDEKFTLKELIKGINILMSNELKKNSCKLNINTNMHENDIIKGSLGNLIQVINVLISNAIQAYPTGNGQIDLSIMKDEEKIEISIQDYGIGIPKHIQDKLLNKMVTTKGNKGTGIGLYISNSIIKAKFNGSIHFSSEEGKGTIFYITLPIRNEGEE